MLRRLTVRNFKSLKELSLDVRDRNVLIGPNKSGKSSLLDCLRFLCQIMTFGDIEKPLAERGGLPAIAWKGARTIPFNRPAEPWGQLTFSSTATFQAPTTLAAALPI